MLTANAALRQRLRNAHIPLWRVAQKVGIHHQTLIDWLRFELTGERLQKVNNAVAELLKAEESA